MVVEQRVVYPAMEEDTQQSMTIVKHVFTAMAVVVSDVFTVMVMDESIVQLAVLLEKSFVSKKYGRVSIDR